jgi:excisionase family DNA binding protein
MINDNKHILLNSHQVADYLGVVRGTLGVWRCTKRYDLPYVKIGRLVKYKLEDLNKFIEDRAQ